jgi:SPOR domain
MGMADSGTINKPDFSSQIDDDDPLMELSRIIGLEPRRETASRYAPSPQAAKQTVTEAVELPAAPEMSDVLQKDLANELIASLESEDDFSSLAAEEGVAEPVAESDEWEAVEPVKAEAVPEPVPHIAMSPQASVNAASSLEDELEAILNPAAARHVPFGMRPVEETTEPVEHASEEDFEESAARAESAPEPALALEDEIEPALEEAQEEVAYEEPSQFSEAAAAPEPVEAEQDDYWSRAARRTSAIPAYVPDDAEAVAAEDEEIHLSETPAAAPLAAAAPQFEPIVDIIAHEGRGVEMTGEFDVPEFDYEAGEQRQSAADASDEYDGGYEPAYRPNGSSYAPAPAVETARLEDEDYDQINEAVADLEQERGFNSEGLGQAAAVAASAASMARPGQTRRDFVLDDDDNFGASLDVPLAPAAVRRSPGRSYLMAAGLGALALMGGIGAYALTRGGDSADPTAAAPVVLKADSSPVKVAPETPGGKVVPNQDIAVFDKPTDAAQTELVSKTEAPVDLAAKAAPRVVLPGPAKTDPALQEETVAAPAEPQPSAKSEERVAEQPADDASLVKTEVASVSPKKVRTMVVKSDGTLEERAAAPVEPAPAPDPVETAMVAPAESAVPAKKVQTSAIVPDDAVGTVAKAADPAPAKVEEIVTAAAAPEAVADPAPAPAAEAQAAAEAGPAEAKPVVKPVKVKKATQKAAKTEALREVAAANIPLVDGRPSDQPVTIVAKTGKTPQAAEEVAALTPAPTPSGGPGGYVIQIASAPSPDAAQATWASLNRKFGSVLGGRSVKIQKADIPGKGTFYRVRIAAGSKKDAAALCARYKSAGGQCLVAK